MAQKIQISIRLSEKTIERLESLCKIWGMGRAEIIETALADYYNNLSEPRSDTTKWENTLSLCRGKIEAIHYTVEQLDRIMESAEAALTIETAGLASVNPRHKSRKYPVRPSTDPSETVRDSDGVATIKQDS